MIEKQSFNNSFNENFCIQLEMHVCAVFSNSNIEELKHFWCDGVSHAPFYNDDVNKVYLRKERVLKEKIIETTAWLGESGQDIYRMIIKLGQKAQLHYSKGENLKDCLPSEKTMNWVKLDIYDKTIELSLL